MGRDEDKLIRQLSLLSFLLSRSRPIAPREIQDSVEGYFGMSDETFNRRFYGDREDLKKIGIDVQTVGGGEPGEVQAYYLPEEGYYLPGLMLSQDELRALALALMVLEGKFAYARPLRLALTAIAQGQPDAFLGELDRLPVALAPDEDAQKAGKQLARLQDAVSRGKTVGFQYPSSSADEIEERILDPYSLFLIQGRWYAVGFDHSRQGIRTFRVARIRGPVRFGTEKPRDFSVPPNYDPNEYRARPPWLIGTPKGTAVVQVDEDVAWWVSRLQPHVEVLGIDPSGRTRVSIPYADEAVLLAWVVGLGACCELVEPPEMRARLFQRLSEVCSVHRGPAPEATLPRPAESVTRGGRTPAGAGRGPIAAERLARAIALLQHLVDPKIPSWISWKELEKDLALSRKEIEEDISLLNLVNFGGGTYAVYAEADEQGVTVTRDLMADAFTQPARLSPVMARALLLALDLLGDAVALTSMESLASVKEKMARLTGGLESQAPVIVDDVRPVDHGVMETLHQALREQLLVEIEYFTPMRGALTTRLVEPYLLFRSRDGWYLEAYCLAAEAQRTFRLDLVRGARITAEHFSARTGVDLTLRRAGMPFVAAPGTSWAQARFRPRWRGYLDDQGLDAQPTETGDLRVRVPYLDERWMVREVLRFLGDAELEQPGALRKAVADAACSLAETYRSAL